MSQVPSARGVAKALLLGVLGVAACATPVTVIETKHEDQPPPMQQPDSTPGQCDVQDFPDYGDVPEGAKNLGDVSVPKAATDEDTYAALRQAVCAKGGDAMSTLRWLHTIGKKDGPPTDLQATAWQLP